MCGILAVFTDNQTPEDKDLILEDSFELSKRGPDGVSSIVSPDGIYIFHRLAINDLSNDGQQPMVSGNIKLMCNGEIYNFKELIEEYKLECKSKSDCEVILRLYEKIGFTETIKKLYGVYAIVLVDGDIVYIARDRIGVRPLYQGKTKEGYLAVASIPNCLINFCNEVEHVIPGSIIVYNKKYVQIEQVINNTIRLPQERISSDIVTQLRNTLIEAVRCRLVTDRPIGCLLSGGLDSSIITAILVSLVGKDNVRTYSIGMEGATDLYYAKKVSEYLGTKHTEVLFTPEEGFDIIPEVIKAIGSYDITTIRASVGMYLVSKYIAKHTDDRVIFSGEGSDELLQGYLYFHNAPSIEDGEWESLRLVKNLYLYDVLRADRCISMCGLEPRVPFLDKRFVDLTLSLRADDKVPKMGYEKYILRKAFEGFLPEEIIWRRKEGFSDGVSSIKKSWYNHIREKVDLLISDFQLRLANMKFLSRFPHQFPSKESLYYRNLFDQIFPNYKYLQVPYWMPKWSDSTDPSGRLISVYDEKVQV
jgi:asparagine synthase (glutamine-hydrolysing)